MKIYDERDGLSFCLYEDSPVILSIEKVELFLEFVQSLWRQFNGMDGFLFLSDKEKEMKISKEAEVIVNPFQISLNDKRIINQIYKELSEVALEYCYEDTISINQKLIVYMDRILERIPYPVIYHEELDVIGLFKCFKIQFEEETDFLERIVSYIRMLHQVCGISVMIFVGLKMYLTKEQLEMLYQTLVYEKIYFIDIENKFLSKIKSEKNFILDQDLCIIEV